MNDAATATPTRRLFTATCIIAALTVAVSLVVLVVSEVVESTRTPEAEVDILDRVLSMFGQTLVPAILMALIGWRACVLIWQRWPNAGPVARAASATLVAFGLIALLVLMLSAAFAWFGEPFAEVAALGFEVTLLYTGVPITVPVTYYVMERRFRRQSQGTADASAPADAENRVGASV